MLLCFSNVYNNDFCGRWVVTRIRQLEISAFGSIFINAWAAYSFSDSWRDESFRLIEMIDQSQGLKVTRSGKNRILQNFAILIEIGKNAPSHGRTKTSTAKCQKVLYGTGRGFWCDFSERKNHPKSALEFFGGWLWIISLEDFKLPKAFWKQQ